MKSSNIFQVLKTKGHTTDGTAPTLPGVGSPLKLGKKPSKKEKTLDVQRKKDIELAATKTQLMVAKNPISPPKADAKLEVKRSKLPSLEVNSSVQSKLDWAADKRKAKAKPAKQPAKRKPQHKKPKTKSTIGNRKTLEGNLEDNKSVIAELKNPSPRRPKNDGLPAKWSN